MPLTIAQQIDLITDNAVAGGYKLTDFVSQVSINEIEDFYLNKKNFDAEAYPLATIYVRKIDIVSKDIKERPARTLNSLVKIMVGILANTATPEAIASATTGHWSTFLISNIKLCFEILGGVFPEEKTEYNTI